MPSPPNDVKNSSSLNKLSLNRLSLCMSKKDANGLLEPKNCANVARGSPWNSYVKFCDEFVVPFDVPR